MALSLSFPLRCSLDGTRKNDTLRHSGHVRLMSFWGPLLLRHVRRHSGRLEVRACKGVGNPQGGGGGYAGKGGREQQGTIICKSIYAPRVREMGMHTAVRASHAAWAVPRVTAVLHVSSEHRDAQAATCTGGFPHGACGFGEVLTCVSETRTRA